MAKVIHLIEQRTVDTKTFVPDLEYHLVAVDPFDGNFDISSKTKIDLSAFTEAQRSEFVGIFELMKRTVSIYDLLEIPNRRISTGSLAEQAAELTTNAVAYAKKKETSVG